MLKKEMRQQVVEYGKKLVTSGLTTGTGGNISVFDRERGLLAVSPSGMDYEATTAEDVVLLRLDGTVVQGERRPSSETPMHRLFYASRPDCNAVVHTHSPAITAFSCYRRPLPPVSYIIAMAGGEEIPCAPYHDFGGEELGQAAVATAGSCNAVILANHGLVALGKDVDSAFQLAQQMEFCAEVYMRCLSAGQEPVLLTPEEMARARKRFGTYGQSE